jgi:hypothetical protein
MKKPKESFDNSDKGVQLNSTDQDELLKGFDKKRRDFLKKLLISAAYVTPAILSFSIGDLEARGRRRRPTRKKKKVRRRR